MKKIKKAKEYSLKDFMEMELTENSILIEEKIGDNYIGPFSKRLRRLSASYNVNFPELVPAFRKLDLILASGDKDLVEAALRIDNITIDNLVKNKAAELLIEPKQEIDKKDVYLLTNDAGWETWPDEADGYIAPGGGNSNDRNIKSGGGPAFTHCHETLAKEHKIWIPEFEQVFNQIDKLLIATRD